LARYSIKLFTLKIEVRNRSNLDSSMG